VPPRPVAGRACRLSQNRQWALCGDPGLLARINVMHTIHDPRKTVMNPHNRVGIIEYNIHYIMSSNSLTWPLGRIQMPRRASSTNIAVDTRVALVAHVIELLTIVFKLFTII
jgi:hypothetical protein